jgi:hypothetical protein
MRCTRIPQDLGVVGRTPLYGTTATEVPVRPRQHLVDCQITLPERHPTTRHRAVPTRAGAETPSPVWPHPNATPRTDRRLPVPDEPAPPSGQANGGSEVDGGTTSVHEEAKAAFRAGEFRRAESLFLAEAQRALVASPHRAAVSFRHAAKSARYLGDTDASDHWMRRAGREYLRVADDERTPLPVIREAAAMATRCLLSVEDLNSVSKGLRRAHAIESVIHAGDDLMARADGSRIPATPTAPAARPTTGPSADDDDPVSGAPALLRFPTSQLPTARITQPRSPSWLHRIGRRRTVRFPS